MKCKFFIFMFALVISSFSWATVAHSNGFYFGVNAGWTLTNDSDWSELGLTGDIEVNDTINFAGALGYRFNPMFRAEVEVSHRNADLDQINVDGVGSASLGGEIYTTAVLLNGVFDIDMDNVVTPYISAGVGLAYHDVEVNSVAGLGVTGAESDDTVFAYQLGAGITADMNENVAFTTGYRYLGSSDPDFDGSEVEYGAHEIRAGLIFKF